MSKENLDQFIQKVADSEELRARIGDEIGVDSLIALGVEHGCEFTADDLTAGVELSDEELEGVSGGIIAALVAVGFQDSGNGKFRKPVLGPSIIDNSRTSYSGGTDGDDI